MAASGKGRGVSSLKFTKLLVQPFKWAGLPRCTLIGLLMLQIFPVVIMSVARRTRSRISLSQNTWAMSGKVDQQIKTYELVERKKWGMIAVNALAKSTFSQRICACSIFINIANLYLQRVAPTYGLTSSVYLFPHILSCSAYNQTLNISQYDRWKWNFIVLIYISYIS